MSSAQLMACGCLTHYMVKNAQMIEIVNTETFSESTLFNPSSVNVTPPAGAY